MKDNKMKTKDEISKQSYGKLYNELSETERIQIDNEYRELLVKVFENKGVDDPWQPKDFKDLDEYTINQVANSDITEPALYVLLKPNYDVIHLGISKNLRERMKMHKHNSSTSNLKYKILSAREPREQDINAYKVRFLRWANMTLETVENFILLILGRKRS